MLNSFRKKATLKKRTFCLLLAVVLLLSVLSVGLASVAYADASAKVFYFDTSKNTDWNPASGEKLVATFTKSNGTQVVSGTTKYWELTSAGTGLYTVTAPAGADNIQLYSVFIERFAKLCLSKIRMRLYLDKLRRYLPFCFQLCDILALKVRDTYALGFALPIRLLQLTVSCEPISCGLVDIEQVYIVHAESFERFIDRVRILVFTGPELCREENIFSVHAAFFDTASDSAFIDISVCRIDERITHPQRFANTSLRVVRGEHKGTNSNDRAL